MSKSLERHAPFTVSSGWPGSTPLLQLPPSPSFPRTVSQSHISNHDSSSKTLQEYTFLSSAPLNMSIPHLISCLPQNLIQPDSALNSSSSTPVLADDRSPLSETIPHPDQNNFPALTDLQFCSFPVHLIPQAQQHIPVQYLEERHEKGPTGKINHQELSKLCLDWLDRSWLHCHSQGPSPVWTSLPKNIISGHITQWTELTEEWPTIASMTQDHESRFNDQINLLYEDKIAPGLERGLGTMAFDSAKLLHALLDPQIDQDETRHLSNESQVSHSSLDSTESQHTVVQKKAESQEVDSLLPAAANPNILPSLVDDTHKEWAVAIDVNLPFPDFYERVGRMAMQFPFELDTFQKRSVYHLERQESVFVAAHTSAGKTVVAEYAIALAMQHMTRVIYTSPIKALSNQKFRDFKVTFGEENVGILTGDVQIRPEACILVMTTEILKSMLYRNAEMIADVEFVVFDEVHYVNDSERGVVWEEVLIMLPPSITLILLSATVPNTFEFADWVGRTKKKPIYVVSTLTRPVPLEFYLFNAGKMFRIVNARKEYLSAGYKEAYDSVHPPAPPPSGNALQKKAEASQLQKASKLKSKEKGYNSQKSGSASVSRNIGGGNGRGNSNLYHEVLNFLLKNDLVPVIIFCFSKRKCEIYADSLSSLNLTTASQKSEIHVFLERALNRLQGDDKLLPQILRMKNLLLRGIGVHHSGVLPILKEITEILFTRGLIKVLFATETFAMGVNAPAKAVVFSSLTKHDGQSMRDLLPGEFTQMSGRAGRRGLDSIGIVLIVCEPDIPSPTTLGQVILGHPSKLVSQFRLTYSMILNLCRVKAIRIEEMIKKSFGENLSQKHLPEHEKLLLEAERKLSMSTEVRCAVCRDIRDYHASANVFTSLNNRINDILSNSAYAPRAFCVGRVVILQSPAYRNVPAAIIKKHDNGSFFDVLLLKEKDMSQSVLPAHISSIYRDSDTSALSSNVEYVSLADMSVVSDIVIPDMSSGDDVTFSVAKLAKSLQSVLPTRASALTSPLTMYECSKLKQIDYIEQCHERRFIMSSLVSGFACIKCPEFLSHYTQNHMLEGLRNQYLGLARKLDDENLALIPEYNQRLCILRELNFLDAQDLLTVKGRVGCEINTADELLLTELIFQNFFAEFEPAEVVALLSCFVFQERVDGDAESLLSELPPQLARGVTKMMDLGMTLQAMQSLADIGAPEVKDVLKIGLVGVVYDWALGKSFRDITARTTVLEGSIVRCIVRLDETCRELAGAGKVIGDAALCRKALLASESIKRDIVFAASLYY